MDFCGWTLGSCRLDERALHASQGGGCAHLGLRCKAAPGLNSSGKRCLSILLMTPLAVHWTLDLKAGDPLRDPPLCQQIGAGPPHPKTCRWPARDTSRRSCSCTMSAVESPFGIEATQLLNLVTLWSRPVMPQQVSSAGSHQHHHCSHRLSGKQETGSCRLRRTALLSFL